MNLHREAKEMAQEALDQQDGDFGAARDMLHEMCDGHETVIYHHKAIKFCAEQNTSDGEQWLKDCGGIVQPYDSFGQIASYIAFATLYLAACEALDKLEQEVAA
jgi:hypothetical protein